MNINTLIDTLKNAVHDDTDTQTFCLLNYGQKHKVYVGVDTRNPPGEDDYPLVHIFPAAKTVGYEVTSIDHIIEIVCGIHDSDLKTFARDNLTQYEAISDLETFRKYVETAVADVIPTNCRIDRIDIEYETIEFFPFFLAGMEMTIVQDLYSGDDPLG